MDGRYLRYYILYLLIAITISGAVMSWKAIGVSQSHLTKEILMNFFNKVKDFPYIRWGEGFFIGMMLTLSVSAVASYATPIKTEIKIVEVEKIVEKSVVVKEPIYLNKNDKQQISCMAENAYFEAGNEPTKGIIAVNNVVLNRVNDKRFPNTPCGVISQRTKRVCQFSWKCEGRKVVRDQGTYTKAKKIAEHVYLGNYSDVTNGAQFYHADYVSPSWGRVFNRTTKIGAHIFYRG
tara:strand:- start:1467 stop:2171 length:705 start_codon:yes stop_codon:yes gene_type:complete